MKNKLFAEMTGKQKPTGRWLFLPVSFIFHTIIIAAVVVTPLLTTDSQLPPIKTIYVMITQPQTLSLPVGSSRSRSTRDKLNRGGINREKRVKPVQSTVLTEPVEIPDKIEEDEFFDIGGNYGNGNSDILGALESTGDTPGALPGNGSDNSGPIRNLKVEQIPRLIKKVTPQYPEIALKARVQGRVIIEAETDIYGRVTTVKVIAGLGLLTAAAVEAVRKWVYEPYIINGFPRPVRFTVTLEFTLKHR